MLRLTFLFLFVSLISACANNQKPIDEEDISVFEHGVIAKVTTEYESEGCEVLLELQDQNDRALLMPVDLDDKYKVHGLELLITYNSSRIMQSKCQMGRPILIEKIRLVE